MPTAQPSDETEGARCAHREGGRSDQRPSASEFPVGIIGAGFIIDSVALRAYARAGIKVVAIASRHSDRADAVAKRWGSLEVIANPPPSSTITRSASSRWPIPPICRSI